MWGGMNGSDKERDRATTVSNKVCLDHGAGGRHASGSRIWAPCLAFCLTVGIVGLPANGPVRASARAIAAPATTTPPPAVNLLGGTPGSSANGPVTFAFSRHYYHPGDTVSASFHLTSTECRIIGCYLGTVWTNAGAPPNHCSASAAHCSWKVPATIPLDQWQGARMPVTTTAGMMEADDFYAVIPRSQSVLEAHVTDTGGAPYGSLMLHLSGPVSATLQTDSSGYAVGVVPSGRYNVRLDTGVASDAKWFRPVDQSLSVRGVARTHIVGYRHLQMRVSSTTALANGLQAITVTVGVSTPFGQPAGNLPVVTSVSGPKAVVCALQPSQPGYVEPLDAAAASPLFRPVNQTTAGPGTLTYQVFFGTEPGVWTIAVRDASVGSSDPWRRRLIASARVTLKPASWARFFPTRLTLPLYGVKGRGKTAALTLSQTLWYALRGETTPVAPRGSNGLTLANLNLGDPMGSQTAALQWMETFVPLSGLEIGPVYAGASTDWGVAIFQHGHYEAGSVTRVLDAATLSAFVSAPTPTTLPALPTLTAWAARMRSTALRGFAEPSSESGLTYNGLPYLPRDPTLFGSFQSNCSQRAPLSPS